MKILLDECVDWRLGRELTGHEVSTPKAMGWASKRNGELLALAAERFEAFVTTDRNLEFQQSLGRFALRILVLRPRRNRLPELLPLVPALLEALETAPLGRVTPVG